MRPKISPLLALAIAAPLLGCGGAAAPATPASPGAGGDAPAAIVDDPRIEVLTLTAQPALLRTVRAAPADLGDALTGAIFGLIAATSSSGAEPAGPPFARYLSRGDAADPTMVVEAGLPVVAPPTGALPDDVVAGELPAGEAVALVFVGPHERLGEAHAALDGWLAAHRRDAAGPRWEVFLTNPVTTPDPEQQRTKVFVPLREVAP